MSPRGVVIPNVREQLFSAAERVLARKGPGGLTSRAITAEAGVAKGLLYKHFDDLDDFLAELALDRFRLAAQLAAPLPSRAGQGTVAGNLADAAESVFGPGTLAIGSVVLSSPSLLSRLGPAITGGAVGFDQLEGVFAAYLDAERELGRVTEATDTQALAIALIGTLHHLFLTHRADGPRFRSAVQRIVEALVTATAPESQEQANHSQDS